MRHERQFAAEIGRRKTELAGNALDGGVKAQSRFGTDNHKVERVRQVAQNGDLAVRDHALKDNVRDEAPEDHAAERGGNAQESLIGKEVQPHDDTDRYKDAEHGRGDLGANEDTER